MLIARLSLIAALATLLVACGASNTGVPIPGFTTPSPGALGARASAGSSIAPSSTPISSGPAASISAAGSLKPGSRCAVPDPALASAVSAGLQSGVTMRNAYVVQADEGQKLYFLAADLEGVPGLEAANDVAVFASDSAQGGGTIYAVGATANEFSDFDDGHQTDAKLTVTDDGARQARSCALGN